jgi:hypothetical protein
MCYPNSCLLATSTSPPSLSAALTFTSLSCLLRQLGDLQQKSPFPFYCSLKNSFSAHARIDMPTSELTGLGDKFNSQRLQIELSVFETVQSIICVRTTLRILLTLDLFAAVGMACMLTCGSKILSLVRQAFTTTIPGWVSGTCPTTMTQVITVILERYLL